MKFLIITLALMTSFAFASEKQKEPSIQEIKSKITATLDQKISNLNTFKSCVQSSSNKEALKDCRKSFKESMLKSKNERKKDKK